MALSLRIQQLRVDVDIIIKGSSIHRKFVPMSVGRSNTNHSPTKAKGALLQAVTVIALRENVKGGTVGSLITTRSPKVSK